MAIKKGCTISNTTAAIIIKKDGFQLAFDWKNVALT